MSFSPIPGLPYSECQACLRLAFPPTTVCSVCKSPATKRRSGARAALRSWTTVRKAPSGFEVPYVLGWVEIDAPPLQVLGRFEQGTDAGSLQFGTPVKVTEVPSEGDGSASVVSISVAP